MESNQSLTALVYPFNTLSNWRLQKRYSFLIAPFLIGLVFDWSQQLRGEHFFSHGLFDLLIVWTVSNVYYSWFKKKQSQTTEQHLE